MKWRKQKKLTLFLFLVDERKHLQRCIVGRFLINDLIDDGMTFVVTAHTIQSESFQRPGTSQIRCFLQHFLCLMQCLFIVAHFEWICNDEKLKLSQLYFKPNFHLHHNDGATLNELHWTCSLGQHNKSINLWLNDRTPSTWTHEGGQCRHMSRSQDQSKSIAWWPNAGSIMPKRLTQIITFRFFFFITTNRKWVVNGVPKRPSPARAAT